MIKAVFEKVLCIERSTAIMKTNRELIRNVQPQDNNVNEPNNTSCYQHCEYTTQDNGALEEHMKQVHEKIRERRCSHCDYISYGDKDLIGHIQQTHGIYQCTHCNYKK